MPILPNICPLHTRQNSPRLLCAGTPTAPVRPHILPTALFPSLKPTQHPPELPTAHVRPQPYGSCAPAPSTLLSSHFPYSARYHIYLRYAARLNTPKYLPTQHPPELTTPPVHPRLLSARTPTAPLCPHSLPTALFPSFFLPAY